MESKDKINEYADANVQDNKAAERGHYVTLIYQWIMH